MTRTFSKIYGLASLRIGWAYCPTEIADALNRIRGPFNVSGPAIAAGVAALADQAQVQRAVEHNEVWLGRMTEALSAIGIGVTPSAANFLLLHFRQGQRQIGASRRHIPASAAHHLAARRGVRPSRRAAPDHRQRGGEPRRARRADIFHGRQRRGPLMTKPLFDTLAIIGMGLIGSSIARAARAQGRRAQDRGIRAFAEDAKARRRARPRRQGDGDQRRGRRRRRPRHRLRSSRGLRRGRRGDRPASQARRHDFRCGFGEGLGRARHGPASAEDRAFRPGPSGRRHRAFRSRRGLRRAVREPLVHPDAARRAPSRKRWTSSPRSGVCSAPTSKP